MENTVIFFSITIVFPIIVDWLTFCCLIRLSMSREWWKSHVGVRPSSVQNHIYDSFDSKNLKMEAGPKHCGERARFELADPKNHRKPSRISKQNLENLSRFFFSLSTAKLFIRKATVEWSKVQHTIIFNSTTRTRLDIKKQTQLQKCPNHRRKS